MGREAKRDSFSESKGDHEDFANDKPTDPPANEKTRLIEDSKAEFFKRKKIELTNLPNDPKPEVILETFANMIWQH